MNLGIIITITMTMISGLIVFAAGFAIGRRSAYKDLEMNLGKPQNARHMEGPIVTEGLGYNSNVQIDSIV